MQRSSSALRVFRAVRPAAAMLVAALMVPAGWAQDSPAMPSAPSAQVPVQRAVSSSQPFDVQQYSQPQSHFPNPLGPYTARRVAPPNLANTSRIDGLMHDGKLYTVTNEPPEAPRPLSHTTEAAVGANPKSEARDSAQPQR